MLVLPEIKTETKGKKSPIVKVSKNDVKKRITSENYNWERQR